VRHKVTGELHQVRCACTYEDLPLRLVYQAEKSGCVLAAVATATGLSYAEVRQYVDLSHDFTENGTYLSVAASILDRLGYAVQTRYRNDPRLGGAPRDPWPSEPWADVILCEVTNLPNRGQHAVVLLTDGRVLDPWWGVVQGLHRYPAVHSMTAVYRVGPQSAVPSPES
jgi:hypothetical protein